ncbi:MAG TPA: ribosome maturation factor RimP [Azospirillaceae bacterium]|nr:ribosome maturation factor RimP [Azospirillaceae bacterium]
MDAVERIEGIITPTVEGMGYELVRVLITGGARPTLQIMAERQDGAGMTVDDCAEISRAVSALLDVEDPIAGAYTLEVSSPGIDRPLTRLKDFSTYAGYDARVEANAMIDGRRRFTGVLRGVEGEDVLIETTEGTARIPFGLVMRAKLVLTDALLRSAARAQGVDMEDGAGGNA